MHQLRYIFATLVLVFALFAPLSASALGTSFGGRIVALTPCLSALGPSIWFTIIPAGFFPISYIWTPLSVTYMAGPPTHIGQQILGVADIPYACKVGPVFLFGQRVQIQGTSAL